MIGCGSSDLGDLERPNDPASPPSYPKSEELGEKRNAYRILVGKPEGKRPLGKPRRRWVDNIKMDLREIGWDGVDWNDMAHDRNQWRALVNTVLNLRVQ
jgi:hypothetical protein